MSCISKPSSTVKRSDHTTVPLAAPVSRSKSTMNSTLSRLPLLRAVVKPQAEPSVREKKCVRFTEDTKAFDAADDPFRKVPRPRNKRKATEFPLVGPEKRAATRAAVNSHAPLHRNEGAPRAPAPASRPPPTRSRTRALHSASKFMETGDSGADTLARTEKGAAAQHADKDYTPSLWHKLAPRAPAAASRPPPVRVRSRTPSSDCMSMDACDFGAEKIQPVVLRKPKPHWIIAHLYLSTTPERFPAASRRAALR